MNHRLRQLFEDDQIDRVSQLNNSDLRKRDVERGFEVKRLLRLRRFSGAEDFYRAAMILHHGPTIEDSEVSISLAEKAVEAGLKEARWLYAAATDRLLMKRGEAQKFGTQYQYIEKGDTGIWKLYPIDPTITDDQRRKFSVPPLAKLQEQINCLNKKRAA